MLKALILFITMQFFFLSLSAIDNVHFYRPNFFWGEPRLECPWLTTVNVVVGGGKANSGYNEHGKKTGILNIYGTQNMQNLAANVTDLNPANPLDAILISLNELPSNGNFGHLALRGKFTIVESAIDIYQNIQNGFFFELYIPARKLAVDPELNSFNELASTDLSPHAGTGPNKTNPEWQAFLKNFFAILRHQGISVQKSNRSGVGDISFLAGWACTYQDTTYIDFIDVAAKIGILFPTGKKINYSNPFELPQGYNGHWGVPLKFDLSFGAWEWFTGGLHLGSLYLAEKTQRVRILTSETQNSFIKLAQADASIDPGIYFDFDLFAKADHFCKGLSLLLAYSFNFKEQDTLELQDTTLSNNTIANGDPLFAGWRQHVLQFMIEYDFAKKISDIGTRIGFFYNHILGGKRIWRTNMAAGYVGIDATWYF